MKKYRLTFLFAVTAVMVIAMAATAVNVIVGNLAEDNLISPHFPFRLKAKLERRQIYGFNSNFSSDIGAQSL